MSQSETDMRSAVRAQIQQDIDGGAAPFDIDMVMGAVDVLPTSEAESGLGRAELIRIALAQDGSVRRATSRKLGNLRVKIGETLSRGVAETGLAIGQFVYNMNHPVLVALNMLKFLHYSFGLVSIQIETRDAELLLRVYAFEKEEGRVDIDAFDGQMARLYKPEALRESMDRLEKLGCLRRADAAYVLNEDILITEAK